MTDLDQLLLNRRSIRAYSGKMPDGETLELLLASVVNSPSPSNLQPVRFIRIRSANVREKLRFEMNEGHRRFLDIIEQKKMKQNIKNWVNSYYRYSEFMFISPVIFAVGTVENEKSFSKVLHHAGLIEKDLRGETDMDISVGLAINALMLKAVDLGLATCILSAPLTYIDDVEKVLGLDSIRIKCFVTIGYPAEFPTEISRRDVSEIYREV